MIKLRSRLFLSSLALTTLSPAFAVEPPLIVNQQPEEFVEPSSSETDVPDEKSLTTTEQQGAVKVENVQFQGGSVFELEQLFEKVKPIIGQTVSKPDLLVVLRSITAMYQEAGYALSFAFLPNQNIQDGQLTIVLVEGYVAESDIQIADDDVRRRVERLAAKMQNEKPLKRETFERYLRLIENTPGYKLKVNVPKPKKVNGATLVRVEEVETNDYELNFGLDDSQEEDIRVLAGASVNSMTSYGDKLTVSTLIPNDTVDEYYAINYQQDIGTEGLQLELSANQFESQGDDRIFVSDVPINYEENKQRQRYSAGLKYPITLSKSTEWWVGSKLHHLDEDALYELNRADGLGDTVGIDKELRYSAFELNSQWQYKSRQNIFFLSAYVKQGIEIGSNKNIISDASGERSGAENVYFTATSLTSAWRHLLSPHWRLQTKANVFWSDDILPSAEQVRYGGRRYGRGYPDGQAQGDRGYAAELELRYVQPLPNDIVRSIEPYVVVDGAKAELRANNNEYELSSAAVGFDISDSKHYTLGLEYAKPLGDPHYETGDRDPVYNVRVRWNF